LKGHTDQVVGVAFSPDGQRLIAADFRKNVKAWEVATGRQLPAGQERVAVGTRAQRSPDGQLLALADGNLVRLIQVVPDAQELAYPRAAARPHPGWHSGEAQEREKAGQWFAAAFHLSQVLRARPEPDLYRRLAAALEKLPDDEARGDQLALASLGAGDVAAYRRTCQRLLERSTAAEIGTALSAFRPTPLQVLTARAAAGQVSAATPWDKAAVARACVLLPDAVAG